MLLNKDKFKKHQGVGRSFISKASINKRGNISISDGAVRRFGLQDKDWACLYYDADERIVAIEPLVEKTEDSLRLRKRTTGGFLAAASFVGNFQIDLEGTTVCELKQDSESGWLYFELNEGKLRKS